MDDYQKTKKQLIAELAQSRERIAQLEQVKAEHKQLEAGNAKQALRGSSARYSAMIENIGDVIGIVDVTGTTIYQSPNIERWFGWKPDDLIGTNGWDKMHPNDVERIQKEFIKMLEGATPQTVEYRFRCKNGRYKWIELTAANLINDPAIGGVLLNYRDITARKKAKKAEKQLEKSEKRFRELVNTINSGVAVYKVINEGRSGSDFIIQDFNEFALNHEQMKKEDVIGKSLKDIRPNIDEYGLIDTFRAVWKTGESAFFPAKVYVDDKYSNYYENRVFRLPSGEIVAVYDDVSDRENAITQIKTSQQRFDLAMKASRDGLYDWNLVTNDIYFSPGWKSMLGYRDDELPNTFSVWEDLTDPEDVKKSWTMINELTSKKRDRFEMEFKMKHKDGHWVDILSRADAILNEAGEAVRVIGTHVDISERKQAEKELIKAKEQAEKSEEKFKSLMQQSPFVVELYDFDGLQIAVNKSYEELWEFPAETTLKKFNVLKSKEVIDSGLMEYVKRAYSGESVNVPEYRFDPTGDTEARGRGRIRWLSTRIYPIKDEPGRVTNIVIVHQDISGRKRAEEELENYRNDLENLVEQRTEELQAKMEERQKLFDLMVGREVRMAELKKVIKKLRTQIEDAGLTPMANDPLLNDLSDTLH